jgi:cytidine deaminase
VKRSSHEGTTIDEADLLRRARSARERAYAPYSGFRVGAVVVTDDGRVFEGANVENASFPLSICAERVAVHALASSGRLASIVAVGIVGDGRAPCPPCGACRQVIFEFGPDAVVYASGGAGRPLIAGIRELLAHPFGPRRLAQGRGDG